MIALEPPDEAIVVRLLWSPEDIVDGQVTPSGFPKADLKSPARYMSVDLAAILSPPVVRCVARRQHTSAAEAQARAAADTMPGNAGNQSQPKQREQAFIAQLECSAVRAMEVTVEENKVHKAIRPLCIEPKPIEPGGKPCPLQNDAHCAVLNRSGQKGDAFLLSIRTKLAALSFGVSSLEEFLKMYGERNIPEFGQVAPKASSLPD